MTDEIVNLTRYVVCRKIEEIVKNPSVPYGEAFANPYLRQKLLVKVLNDAVPRYIESAPKQETFPDHSGQFPITLEEEKQIEATIRENILKVLHEEDAMQYFCADQKLSCSQ